MQLPVISCITVVETSTCSKRDEKNLAPLTSVLEYQKQPTLVMGYPSYKDKSRAET